MNTCLNNPVPSSTPNPAAAPSAPNPEFQNAVSSASPLSSFWPTDYGPDFTAFYNSALGGLPLLGYPASSLEQIASNAVTGALSVGKNAVSGAVNAGIDISNTIGTGVNNVSSGIGEVLNTSFGGLSPTLPIFYLPSNPFQPTGPLTS
jgi:hypothetical protein